MALGYSMAHNKLMVYSTMNNFETKPDWPSLEEFKSNEFASPNTFNKRVQGLLDRTEYLKESLNEIIFKRSLFLELPFIFKDYETAYAAVSPVPNGYLYPQGFAHDDQDNTYINYAAANSRSVIVKYDKNGTYIGYCLIISGSPEDIVVKRESDVLKLYTKTTSHVLAWADITSNVWKGETLTATEISSVQSVHLQMDYDKGRWIIEQRYADLGQSVSRTKYRIYDDNFVHISDFYTQRSVVGFQTSTNEDYPYIPKTQGVALKDGHILFGLGGSYIPSVDGLNSSMPVSAIGLAKLSLNGDLISYGAINARKYLDVAQTKYSYAIRTEAEGLSKLSDGTLTQLIILGNRNINDQNKASGIIIEKLMDPTGFNYASYAEAYTPIDLNRFDGVFPRGYDGNLYNPFTQNQIKSVQEIVDFLFSAELDRTSWYSSAVNLTPLSGMEIPPSSFVTVENLNNASCIISVTTANTYTTKYFYNGSSLFIQGLNSPKLKIHAKTSDTQYTSRLVALNINNADKEVSIIQYTSTPFGNVVNIGGGTTTLDTCTRFRVQLGSTLASTLGDIIFEATSAGVFPGTADTYSLGTFGNRWNQVITKCIMFNPTTGDFYNSGSPEGVLTAGKGSTYRRVNGDANSTLYIKGSGTGNTGWTPLQAATWASKKYMLFGDSTTQTGNPTVGNFGVGIRANWWDITNIALQAASFRNYAYTGASFREYGQEDWKKLSHQVNTAIASGYIPDVIVVAAVANDGTSNLGTYDAAMAKDFASLDMSLTADAMRYTFKKLNEAFPDAVLFSLTPKQLASVEQASRQPMIDLLIKMSNRYGFQVIDVASTCGIARDFEVIGGAGRDLYDGVHPNSSGIKKIANTITPVIKARMSY